MQLTTLASTSTFFRRTFTKITLAILAIILLFIVINVGKNIINSIFPPPPAPATVAFGKLPKLDLSEGATYAAGTIFTVETISGNIPQLGQSAKVFSVKASMSTFGLLEQAEAKAKNVGFDDRPVEVGDGRAKFVDPKDKYRILTIETTTGNFGLQSDYLTRANIISMRPRSADEAKRLALNFFKAFGLSEKDFPEEKITLTYYKLDAGKLVGVTSLSEANLVSFAFNRAEIDGLPVINLNAANPSVWALVSNQKIVEAIYFPVAIQKYKFSSYPLKDSLQAYEDLKNGKGTLNKKIDGKVFIIRNVKLGYLQTGKMQSYLVPVYIFESDNNLAAYVNAVGDLWIQ